MQSSFLAEILQKFLIRAFAGNSAKVGFCFSRFFLYLSLYIFKRIRFNCKLVGLHVIEVIDGKLNLNNPNLNRNYLRMYINRHFNTYELTMLENTSMHICLTFPLSSLTLLAPTSITLARVNFVRSGMHERESLHAAFAWYNTHV